MQRDVVAAHLQARGARALPQHHLVVVQRGEVRRLPRPQRHVVRAPQPQVVPVEVARVQPHHHVRGHAPVRVRAAHPREHVRQHPGVPRVPGVLRRPPRLRARLPDGGRQHGGEEGRNRLERVVALLPLLPRAPPRSRRRRTFGTFFLLLAPLEQGGREAPLLRGGDHRGLQHQPRHAHPRGARRHPQAGLARRRRHQGRQAQAQHHLVRPGDDHRGLQVVNPGAEHDVLPLRQGRVDARRRRPRHLAGPGHKHPLEAPHVVVGALQVRAQGPRGRRRRRRRAARGSRASHPLATPAKPAQ
mmetsp:Transcript_44832/g.73485  ORF Transcript_44832/g.73485 Transcript_44832/m.73485 type:complete len:301 (+) Transcript_44832:666-1568(+)